MRFVISSSFAISFHLSFLSFISLSVLVSVRRISLNQILPTNQLATMEMASSLVQCELEQMPLCSQDQNTVQALVSSHKLTSTPSKQNLFLFLFWIIACQNISFHESLLNTCSFKEVLFDPIFCSFTEGCLQHNSVT